MLENNDRLTLSTRALDICLLILLFFVFRRLESFGRLADIVRLRNDFLLVKRLLRLRLRFLSFLCRASASRPSPRLARSQYPHPYSCDSSVFLENRLIVLDADMVQTTSVPRLLL